MLYGVKYVFVQLLAFSAKARKLRLTLDDLREIENDITATRRAGPLLPEPMVSGKCGLPLLHPVPERAAACACAISSLMALGAYIW